MSPDTISTVTSPFGERTVLHTRGPVGDVVVVVELVVEDRGTVVVDALVVVGSGAVVVVATVDLVVVGSGFVVVVVVVGFGVPTTAPIGGNELPPVSVDAVGVEAHDARPEASSTAIGSHRTRIPTNLLVGPPRSVPVGGPPHNFT